MKEVKRNPELCGLRSLSRGPTAGGVSLSDPGTPAGCRKALRSQLSPGALSGVRALSAWGARPPPRARRAPRPRSSSGPRAREFPGRLLRWLKIPLGEGVIGRYQQLLANFCKFLNFFGGLVLGCIETKICKQIISKYAFCSIFKLYKVYTLLTAQNSTFYSKSV